MWRPTFYQTGEASETGLTGLSQNQDTDKTDNHKETARLKQNKGNSDKCTVSQTKNPKLKIV